MIMNAYVHIHNRTTVGIRLKLSKSIGSGYKLSYKELQIKEQLRQLRSRQRFYFQADIYTSTCRCTESF